MPASHGAPRPAGDTRSLEEGSTAGPVYRLLGLVLHHSGSRKCMQSVLQERSDLVWGGRAGSAEQCRAGDVSRRQVNH